MLGPHPLFNHDLNLLDCTFWRQNAPASITRQCEHAGRASNILISFCIAFLLEFVFVAFKVLCKVLHQENFLLDLFGCFFNHVGVGLLLSASWITLCIGYILASSISNHLRIVVEVDTKAAVRECVPKPILWTIVNPFLDPYCWATLVQFYAKNWFHW